MSPRLWMRKNDGRFKVGWEIPIYHGQIEKFGQQICSKAIGGIPSESVSAYGDTNTFVGTQRGARSIWKANYGASESTIIDEAK